MNITRLVIDGRRSEEVRAFGPLFEPPVTMTQRAAVVSSAFATCAQVAIDWTPDGPALVEALQRLVNARRSAMGADQAVLLPRPSPVVDEDGTRIAREAVAAQGMPVVVPAADAGDAVHAPLVEAVKESVPVQAGDVTGEVGLPGAVDPAEAVGVKPRRGPKADPQP